MHPPDVAGPGSAGSCPPSRPPPRSESNTSWTAHAGRVGTKGGVTKTTGRHREGPNTKGRVTDLLRKVSPGSQSPRKSLGCLGQMRVPLIAAEIKERRQRDQLEFVMNKSRLKGGAGEGLLSITVNKILLQIA